MKDDHWDGVLKKQTIGAIWLFGALPFLTLIGRNPGQSLPLLWLVAYWVILCAIPSLVVIAVARKNENVAGRLAAVLALAILVVGQLAVGLRKAIGLKPIFGVDGSVWLMAILLVASILISRWKWVQLYVPYLAVAILVAVSVQFVVNAVGVQPGSVASNPVTPMVLEPKETPNVYWFVLDGYARGDVIADIYEDPRQSLFLDELADRGFTVSGDARAAYPMTYLSIASTVSAEYVAAEGDSVNKVEPFHNRIRWDNRVVKTFRSWGYSYLLWPGDGWSGSACGGVEDYCLGISSWIKEADFALLSMTPLPHLFGTTGYEVHAERSDPVAVVETILAGEADEPRFVFAHLMNPHPPYYWAGEECELQNVSFNLRGPFGKQPYVESIRCLNERLISAVDRILVADEDAIIILQGDHGPSLGLSIFDAELDEWGEPQIMARFGVLSAMRAPPDCAVPDDLSLTNTFRVVFDCLSFDSVELLPTRMWIANQYPGLIREIDPHTLLPSK